MVFEDTIRDDVKKSMLDCKNAGIRVIMVTNYFLVVKNL